MNKFEYKTRNVRLTNAFGNGAQKAVSLYNDNCTSHGKDDQIKRLQKKQIHCRELLPGCTHIQQPVDQHIGRYLQTNIQKQYYNFVESLWDEIDEGKRDEKDKVGAKDMRGKIFEFAYNAAKDLKSRKHLIESSWINFGLDLPLDGSKDNDISTIQ